MSKWTTNNIPDLTGKVVVVTGANSGIGYEASVEVARKGAHVVMACRNMQKAEAALASLQQTVPNANAEILQLDLASQQSIRAFADAYNES